MSTPAHTFSMFPGTWAVARLSPEDRVPEWAFSAAGFTSISRTADELSIVAPAASVPDGVRREGSWRIIKLHGPFPFDQLGVLASFAAPLAAGGVSIFAISTFDTDYLLVKDDQADRAVRILVDAGHVFVA